MFTMSIKQLMRKPGMVILFFALLASSTALLAIALVSMIQCNQRIDIVESQFTTIATVVQNAEPGDEMLRAEMLDFDTASYVVPPETRPFLMAYNQELHTTSIQYAAGSVHIVEFSPLEMGQTTGGSVPVKIEKAYYNKFDRTGNNINGFSEKDLEAGDVIIISQYQSPITLLEPGKRYIANLSYDYETQEEYSPYFGPFSTQCDTQGQRLFTGERPHIEEVTEDFWLDSGRGEVWMEWVTAHEWEKNTTALPVLPTNSLDILPSFHNRNVFMYDGREITREEFASGAKVCMLPQPLMSRNILRVGDKIRLPMRCALYGYVPSGYRSLNFTCGYFFTPLSANGKLYEPFWDEEYEIVGSYKQLKEENNELTYDVIIVPYQSIKGNWEDSIAYYDPMNGLNASFQIPNGEIAAFNTLLHKVVPEAAKLEIKYHDNGYENVIKSLSNTRLSSTLLLAVGILATIVIIVLLLYFFVVKEKQRTAIERSLGMTKMQCYVSALSGLFILAFLATCSGSVCGWAAMHVADGLPTQKSSNVSQGQDAFKTNVDSLDDLEEKVYFSREYSLWAENEQAETSMELDDTAISVQNSVFYATPIFIDFIFYILAFFFTCRNLKVEPILLLGGGQE